MRINSELTTIAARRRGERGAALVTSLLLSTLLLAAGGALIMTTAMSATTAIDSTAEMQAYYAAEAGLESALSVLRGNVIADPELGTGEKMDFRKAITLADANDTANGDTTPYSRLSRWLTYTADTPGTRVNLNAAGTTVSYTIRVEEPTGVTTAAGEPPRLMITSTGYGPRGSRKQLQMVVAKSKVDFDVPATIVAAGGDSIAFSLGDSNSSILAGGSLPAIAVAPVNTGTAQTVVTDLNTQGGGGPQVTGSPEVAALGSGAAPTPDFLTSPDNARAFLSTVKGIAATEGRLFSSQAAVTGGLGTPGSPKFTVIDNYNGAAVNLGANQQGTGLLVVTGNLTTQGNTEFQGIILVLGRGNVERSGGGEGEVLGSIIIANFDPDDANADTFGNPTFMFDGGGASTTAYDATAIADALKSTGRKVLGVIENNGIFVDP
ncbi:MAG: hypothetical protein M3430_02590 [Acidobacteriota bacterium]|nr:hypothetical protein [Acidobacteriota bacterium]